MLLLLPDHASGTSVVQLRDIPLRELNCKYPNCKIVEKLRAPARALPAGRNALISDAKALVSCMLASLHVCNASGAGCASTEDHVPNPCSARSSACGDFKTHLCFYNHMYI